ncbi:RHS repeat-associated core domain-containing protein [Sorangium sp. So ce1024]|uniref:RHS repeat-associated core domain-containing protein n=1 Tax=unclassified Sorangium TaxID=2621164 RepID=UPI003F0ADF87
MARTAPVPNIPAIPGMNPGAWIMGGGGAGGGSGGRGGNGGAGDQTANGQNGGNGASGGGNGADSCGTGTNGGCAQCQPSTAAGHPVDVVTGRVFTDPHVDLEIPGPLIPLVFLRQYNSAAAEMDFGLGRGWGFSLGWRIRVQRRSLEVWTSECRRVEMTEPTDEAQGQSRSGWVLSRSGDMLVLDVGAEVLRGFEPVPGDPGSYRLRYLQDLAGSRIHLVHEADRIRVTDTAGRRLTLLLDRHRRIASIHLDSGRHGEARELCRYEYSAAGDLARYRDACGATWRYEYDAEHRLIEEVSPCGLTFHFVYDAAGRCVETWGDYPAADPALDPEAPALLSDGKTTAKGIYHVKLDYYPDGYVEVFNSVRMDRFFGNPDGQVDKAVVGGAVTSWTYDEAGNPTSYTDPMGNTTRYQWEPRSRLRLVIDPLGRMTELLRDKEGRNMGKVDPAGHVWANERDARGLVTAVITPNGHRFEVARDERGLIREERLPTGDTITYDHDEHGNLRRVKLPEGGEWRFEHDELGRRWRATDPLGRTCQVWRDPCGRVVAYRDPAGGVTHLRWDAEGRLVEHINPDGAVHRFAWGGLHRIAALTYPDGTTFRQLFDREGNLVQVRAPNGERHRRWYDRIGRPVREETPDGRSTTFAHDALGRLTKVTNGANESIIYTYNPASELVSAEYADGSVEQFEYDERSLLIAAEGPHFRIEATYDPDMRLVGETQTVAGVSAKIAYVRDALGECKRYETSLGHAVDLERTGRGHVKAVVLDGVVRVDLERDLHGLVRRYRVSSGLLVEQSFDDLDRLLGARLSPATRTGVLAETTMSYSPAGHLLQHTLRHDKHARQQSFTYDWRGRLISAASGTDVRQFSYDALDNVVETTPGAPARAYGRGSLLHAVGDVQLSWDGAGRLRERVQPAPGGRTERTSYAWDGRGCLQRITTASGLTVHVVHDVQGRRLSKIVRRTTDGSLVTESRYVWDHDRLVHEIRKGADGRAEVHTFFSEGERAPVPRLARIGGDWRWVVTHNNGLPVLLADLDGRAATELQLDVWGGTSSGTAPPELALRFSGQVADTETGLHENHFRYYDPTIGRYITPEPMGMLGGWNPFAYCINPVGWVDPLGLMLMRLTTTAPGVDVNDPSPMPYSYDRPSSYNPQPNEWRNYPRSSMQGMPGGPTSGDCEQRIMGHLDPTQQGNPALAGHTVNMHCLGEPGAYPPEPPCPTCRQRLTAFAVRNQCTVDYTMEGRPGGLRFLPNGTIQRIP